MSGDQSRLAMQPREIAERVGEFLKQGDLEGVVSMFHPDCQVFFPPGEPPRLGHDGVRAAFTDFMALRPTLNSTVTGEIINGDTALLQADWEFLDMDGKIITSGRSTEVARKLPNGGWGYFIDCPLGLPGLSG